MDDTAHPAGPAPFDLTAAIVAAIDRHGPLSFDRYCELALYHPKGGFFTTHGTAGRRGGDFITSAETGPLFGAVLAGALDAWWTELGEPPVFVVVECGAGPGTLARSVLAAEPRCARALRYVLVESSQTQRSAQRERLPIEDARAAFPTPRSEDEPNDVTGPIVVSLAEMPAIDLTGVVIANELLDNLPFAVLERTTGGWSEVLIGHRSGRLCEILVEAPQGHRELAEALAPEAPLGGRIPVQMGMWKWLAQALSQLERGRLVCFDYARTTAEMAADGNWLRTYRQHERGGHPLDEPGTKDITTDVALDQLIRAASPSRVRSQAEFLRAHGIEDLVAEGRRIWGERAHLGDLAALTARSRVSESEALLDPESLGGFSVMEWIVG